MSSFEKTPAWLVPLVNEICRLEGLRSNPAYATATPDLALGLRERMQTKCQIGGGCGVGRIAWGLLI